MPKCEFWLMAKDESNEGEKSGFLHTSILTLAVNGGVKEMVIVFVGAYAGRAWVICSMMNVGSWAGMSQIRGKNPIVFVLV
jgi:hypothetical protein